jgi:hypothetical protein
MAEIIHIATGERVWTDVTDVEATAELEILNAAYPNSYRAVLNKKDAAKVVELGRPPAGKRAIMVVPVVYQFGTPRK